MFWHNILHNWEMQKVCHVKEVLPYEYIRAFCSFI